MNDTHIKKLNQITFIINLIMEKFELGFFKPHVDAFISDPANHTLMLDVYAQIEKVIKE